MPNFVFLALGIAKRRNYLKLLWKKVFLYPPEEDFAILGIFEESHIAVKAIEAKMGQNLKWVSKNAGTSIIADNPKRNGHIEVRRVFINSPLFPADSDA